MLLNIMTCMCCCCCCCCCRMTYQLQLMQWRQTTTSSCPPLLLTTITTTRLSLIELVNRVLWNVVGILLWLLLRETAVLIGSDSQCIQALHTRLRLLIQMLQVQVNIETGCEHTVRWWGLFGKKINAAVYLTYTLSCHVTAEMWLISYELKWSYVICLRGQMDMLSSCVRLSMKRYVFLKTYKTATSY